MRFFLRPGLVAALLLLLGRPALAQYQLVVLSPAAVAGPVSGTVEPDTTTWAFSSRPVVGIAQWASPDSLAIDTANPVLPRLGNLAGKIALIRRGGIEFGQKAFQAQQAGAVGVIIVNNQNPPPGQIVGGRYGAQVNIPVIMVPREWALRNASLITAGVLQLQLGNVAGFYANNIGLQPAGLFPPSETFKPAHMVRDTGDMRFRVGGRVFNLGRGGAANITLKAMIERVGPNPQMLYQDSATVTTLNPADTSDGDMLRMFDLVAADPGRADYFGRYRLTYMVSAANTTDENPADNTYTFDFYLDRNSFSKARINTDASAANFYQPFYTIGLTKAGGGALKWGFMHRTGSQGGYVQGFTFLASSDGTPANTLVGEALEAEVHEWVDANNDSTIDLNETTLLGNGTYTYNSQQESGQFVSVDVSDVTSGQPTVQLLPGRHYLHVVSYSGNKTIFIGADDQYIDYSLRLANPIGKEQDVVLFNGTSWGFFSQENKTALRVRIGSSTTDTLEQLPLNARRLAQVPTLGVYPNPATRTIQVSVGDAQGSGWATLALQDLSGRTLRTERMALQGNRSAYTFSVADLPPGLYQVSIRTPRGAASRKLSVVR